MLKLIRPNWPAPRWIKAYTTTRQGGFSKAPFNSLNLGMQTGDNPEDVLKNRELVYRSLDFPQNPIWMHQIHSNIVISADCTHSSDSPQADAIYSKKKLTVCGVLTADCLPLLICSSTNYCIAAIHAGWKGLSQGIIENTIKILATRSEDLLVWLGPAISSKFFIVGEDVLQSFLSKDPEAAIAFHLIKPKTWLASLYTLARQRLNQCGVRKIYGANYCTYKNCKDFFSYRRDKKTGRMFTLIWIEA